jgi:hypothetical protein
MKIKYNCEYCGKEHEVYAMYFNRAKNHFCSRQCHMKFMNRELNPIRMTDEVKEKLRNKRLNSGNGNSYEKTHGKHTHRIVAEQMLGRSLKKDEIVHHIDGNKRNNNPSNLMVMTQSEHCRLHFTKKGGDDK